MSWGAPLAGPEALSRPATAQKSLGWGRSPPLRPPPAPLRGARSAGLRPACEAQNKVPPTAEVGRQRAAAVQDAPHSEFRKSCHFRISYRLPPPLFSRLLSTPRYAMALNIPLMSLNISLWSAPCVSRSTTVMAKVVTPSIIQFTKAGRVCGSSV
jgi:hypothetical protein